MNTQNTHNRLPSLVVGLVTTLWIVTVLAGWHSAFGLSDRAALIVLLVAGITMCTTGMEIQRFGWKNPFNLLGSAIGVLILLLVVAVFTGLPLPFPNSDRSAFIALAALMALKVSLDLLRGIATKFLPSSQRVTLK
jgi:peptidoglycan/LPS O-acetylase OafA/YrhL